MDAQHSYGQGMEKSEAIGGQSNYPPNQNYPPIIGYPPSYQSSIDSNSIPENVKGFAFNDESIRRNFIRKVFSILAMQLAITFVMVLLILTIKELKHFMFRNLWIFLLGIAGILITEITLCCNKGIRRRYPINMIILSILTFCEGICTGYIASVYKPDVVLISLGLTVIMVFGLSIFAIQTKYDFTKWGGVLFTAALLFLVATIIGVFMRDEIFRLILAYIGVTLFSLFLIYDIQQVTGGREDQLDPEEYIAGALEIYIDIMAIFRYLLQIVASSSDD